MKTHPKLWAIFFLLLSPLTSANNDLLLSELVRHGTPEDVHALLKQSIDVNAAAGDGTTALHWAAHKNNLEVADLLLQSGAEPNPRNDYGVTPLWLACTNRNPDMVKMLLLAGANPDITLWTGETILMNCARTGTMAAVAELLGHGVGNLNASESEEGQTALMWAAAEGHADTVQLLIDYGADISGTSKSGFTPLLFSARSGDIETARILIKAGADPNESTTEQGNPLVVASASGHESLALFLLEQGAEPNSSDQNGITPLHHSIRVGYSALNGVRYDNVYRVRPSNNMYRLARALLESGAYPNAKISRSYRLGPDGSSFGMVGATPMFLAAISADIQLMKLLAEHNADPNIKTEAMVSPLIAAARASCTGSCEFQGGNKADEHEIAKALQAVKTLVDMGVDVNAADNDGYTAMHMAAYTGAAPIVQYLADQGAAVDVKSKYGETPWSMASGISPYLHLTGVYGNHEDTANLLLKLGAVRISREGMILQFN